MLRASLAPEPSTAFVESMPERYRAAFDQEAMGEHAQIVRRRTSAPAHVEIWRRLPRGVVVLCIVADDRPGLLSFISAAVVIHGMDVVSALAFTRVLPDGSGEAVDFLWLRRVGETDTPVIESDVRRLGEVLSEIITGALPMEEAVRRARPPRVVPAGSFTHVTFDESLAGLVVLTVETFDRPGLLLAITLALFRAHVQIIATDAVTKGAQVVDRFTIVELDGSPVTKNRRGVVQIEVLDAIDAIARGVS
jgi:[protein-PII] uridylyltransferase